jgi:hypothetical protein
MIQENSVPTVRFQADLPLTDVINVKWSWMRPEQCLPAAVVKSLIQEHAHAWPPTFVANLFKEALEQLLMVGDGDDASEMHDLCCDAAYAAVRSVRPKQMAFDCPE